jgi:hypothetical protein
MCEEKEFNGCNEKAAEKTLSTAFETKHIASYSQLLPAAVIFFIFFENIRFPRPISNPVLLPLFLPVSARRTKVCTVVDSFGRILVVQAEILFAFDEFKLGGFSISSIFERVDRGFEKNFSFSNKSAIAQRIVSFPITANFAIAPQKPAAVDFPAIYIIAQSQPIIPRESAGI